MPMIQSGIGTDVATVDPVAKALLVRQVEADGSSLSKVDSAILTAQDHYLPISGFNDDVARPMRVDRTGGQAIAFNNVIISEAFEGGTLATHRLTASNTTFVPAQTAQLGYRFNNTALTTAGAAAQLYSNRRVRRFQRGPIQAKWRARILHQANMVAELGLMGNIVGNTSEQTSGICFQVTTAGVLVGQLNVNSTINAQTVNLSPALPVGWQSRYYVWDIILDDDEAKFYVQDTETGLIASSAVMKFSTVLGKTIDSTAFAQYGRLHNVTAPVVAGDLIISAMDTIILDANLNETNSYLMPSLGYGMETVPTTAAQSQNYVNSTAPASATLSNTTAGYTTLGGLFQFVAVAGGATDYCLFGFTVPAPYSFVCTGVDFDVWNTGAAVATTPHLLTWFISPDQVGVSLAGTARRIVAGAQNLPIGAVIGQTANRLALDLSGSPVVTNPTRVFAVGLRMPVATATASQIIQGMVNVKGYFK